MLSEMWLFEQSSSLKNPGTRCEIRTGVYGIKARRLNHWTKRVIWSVWQDLNLRPPHSKCGTLTSLSYTQKIGRELALRSLWLARLVAHILILRIETLDKFPGRASLIGCKPG